MIEAFGRTDVGRRRKLNEDSFLVAPEVEPLRRLRRHGRPQRRRGGLEDGGRDARGLHREEPASSRRSPGPTGLDANLSFDGNRLKTAIKLANKRVFQAADNREELHRHGHDRGGGAGLGDAADDRLGRRQPLLPAARRELKQLTRDDSWVSAAWAEGILNADEIEHHPLRNVITKAVGATRDDRRRRRRAPAAAGRPRAALLRRAARHDQRPGDPPAPGPGSEPLEEASARLIEAANEAGGRDNVTVVLLR